MILVDKVGGGILTSSQDLPTSSNYIWWDCAQKWSGFPQIAEWFPAVDMLTWGPLICRVAKQLWFLSGDQPYCQWFVAARCPTITDSTVNPRRASTWSGSWLLTTGVNSTNWCLEGSIMASGKTIQWRFHASKNRGFFVLNGKESEAWWTYHILVLLTFLQRNPIWSNDALDDSLQSNDLLLVETIALHPVLCYWCWPHPQMWDLHH